MTDPIKLDWYGKLRDKCRHIAKSRDVTDPFDRQKTNVVINDEDEAKQVLGIFEHLHSTRHRSGLGKQKLETLKRVTGELEEAMSSRGWDFEYAVSPSVADTIENMTPDRTLDEMRKAFILAVNIIEPDHQYMENPWPMTRSELETSYCQTNGYYWARCGPRPGPFKVLLALDRVYMQSTTPERCLAVLVHELTHVTHTYGGGSVHPDEFWETYAQYATRLEGDERFDQFEDLIGPIDIETFYDEVVRDPNESMIDNRKTTVEETSSLVRAVINANR